MSYTAIGAGDAYPPNYDGNTYTTGGFGLQSCTIDWPAWTPSVSTSYCFGPTRVEPAKVAALVEKVVTTLVAKKVPLQEALDIAKDFVAALD